MRRSFPGFLALAFAVLFAAGTAHAQITLVPGPQHLVAQSPKYIAAADFDGDGFDDAVVSNPASNKVTVLFGQDGTSFGSLIDITVGRVLRGVDAGDFNSDGLPDIATVDFLDGRAFVITNNNTARSRTFNQPVSFKVGQRPQDVVIADFDKKNGQDLAVVNYTIGKISTLFNLGGNRGFATPSVFAAGRLPKRIVSADLNGDGFPDLISVNTGTSAADDVSILLNTGVGSFTQPPTDFVVGAGAKDIAVADVNGDGAPDLLVLNGAQSAVLNEFSVSVLVNRTVVVDGQVRGTGSFDILTPVRVTCPLTIGGIAIQCTPNYIAAADFDADTFVDFAVSFFTRPQAGGNVTTAGLVTAYKGRGTGSFDLSTQVTVGFNPQGIVAADFNGDGVPDIAVAEQGSQSVRILNALRPPPQPIGGACAKGSQCESGFCVDGTCCDTASCPAGQFCNIPGFNTPTGGMCAPPAPLANPCTDADQCASGFCVDNFCCLNRSCPAGMYCNTGQCAPPAPIGVPCSNDNGDQCASGFCTDGVCCSDDRCPAGQSCNIPGFEGACTAKVGDGTACTNDLQCTSGFCTDGFCCGVRSCPDGQSCGIDPREGLCTTEPTKTPTPTRTPTPTLTPTPAPNGNSCITSSNCSSGNCVDAVCCGSASCPTGQFCNIFTSLGTCASRLPVGSVCQVDTDCSTLNCQDGNPKMCAPIKTPTPTPTPTPLQGGDPCNNDLQCAAGLVCGSEQVCCSSRSCPAGSSCRVPGREGTCVLLPTPTPTGAPNGTSCTTGSTCDSGICSIMPPSTNGVCCDTDQCPSNERCDIFGFQGQCSPLLQQGDQCNKNTDCDTGLSCLFDTNSNSFICDIPRTPTPTFLPTPIPTSTAGIVIKTSRSGGCSIGDGKDTGGRWFLSALPIALWIRRSRLQRVRVGAQH